ncbi:MAG: GNAT family protein [Parafilimonas sp.]
MNFKLFYTNNLKLRLINQEVYDFVFTNYSDAEIMSFFELNSTAEFNRGKAKHAKGLSTFNKSFLYFQLFKNDDNKIVGECGFHTWYIDHDRAEIFYKLFNDADKQKGIMTEAIKFVIDYSFSEMHLHRIEALIEPNNVASLKLLEKMNFIKEGYLRGHYKNNGVMEDSVMFSLLRKI